MPYLKYMNDEDLLKSIGILYKTYNSCMKQMTLRQFYSNKIDPIRFHFDMNFNNISENTCIDLEIIRQKEKSIGNAIGYFHQSLIGNINDFEEMGIGGQCDIRKIDNTIFAEIKNKYNTMNSSSAEATFNKLKRFANTYQDATCYLIQIIAKNSIDEIWTVAINHKNYEHLRVRIISADNFYALATGRENAFKELCDVLPLATQEFLEMCEVSDGVTAGEYSIYEMLKKIAEGNKLDILSQLMKDTFSDYNGF